jgi:RNA polymerase sigma-70 factor, ECF subfamily
VQANSWSVMSETRSVAPAAGGQSSLVQRAAAGDEAAFTSLVATHHADMLRLAGVIARDPDLARDAVQNAWHRAWKNLHRVRDRDRIRSWLLTITANETKQLLRRRPSIEVLPDDLLAGLDDPGRTEDFLDLNAALDRLDPRDRELLGLRYVFGYTSVELAEYLDISPEGVRTRLKRIVARVREELRRA